MNDRNKSQLTHDVTGAVSAYLDGRGVKPVETEVSVCVGWCADLAGVISPTITELIDLKLLRRQPRWKYVNGKIPAVESPERFAWQEAYKAADRTMTCLVEVKTSRGDFVGDRKWTLPQPTDLAYLAVPAGMIREEEWPAGWGILNYYEAGGVRQLRPPTPVLTTAEQQFQVVLSIAVRRDHHTRYERWRDLQKGQRLREGEEKTIRRTSDIARAFLQIANGEHGSLENVLDRHRLTNLPHYVMESLNKLWQINLPAPPVVPPITTSEVRIHEAENFVAPPEKEK